MTGAEALDKLITMVDHHVADEKIRSLLREFLADPQFKYAYGGKTRHHAYPGGLAVHTWEVTEKVALWSGNNQLGIAAAVLHDFAKIYAYKKAYVDINNPEGRTMLVDTDCEKKIRHLALSWHMFLVAAEKHAVLMSDRMEIGHAMLAHHSRREWGSPIEPQTEIAHLLAAADMLSMQAEGKEHLK